jgi:hypothetical protein
VKLAIGTEAVDGRDERGDRGGVDDVDGEG